MPTLVVRPRPIIRTTSHIGEPRQPLGLLSTAIHHWMRARDIANDIFEHTDFLVADLATYASYGAPLLAVATGGVAVAAVDKIGLDPPLSILSIVAATVAMVAIAAKPWRDAAQALLDHFEEETGTRVADPDAGLTDVRVEPEQLGERRLWRPYPVRRVEFARGGAPFPAGSWAVFSLLSPRGRLNHLQDVLNRHWAFHRRHPARTRSLPAAK